MRAFYTLLLGITALWAIPGDGATRLYVTEYTNNTRVGAYDATTGAAINANFITGLPGVVGLAGLAVWNNLLFVTDRVHNTVRAYDATTGALINASSS